MSLSTPSLKALVAIRDRLTTHKIEFALGGSGLLASLGLVETVRDWDLTTEEPPKDIEPALDGLEYRVIPPTGIFANQLYSVRIPGAVVEIMSGLAIRKPSGEVHRVQSRITGNWNGIPVGCPYEWAIAYELIGRPEKARMLRDYLECISQLPSQSRAGGDFLNSSQRST